MALHNSPVMVHGSLRSSKCLIDSRWVCKVCDFGLDSVKANQKNEDLGEFAQSRGTSQLTLSNGILLINCLGNGKVQICAL